MSDRPHKLSRSQLLRTLSLTLLAAGAILVLLVLPAEYGIDPTGVGRLAGLTALGESRLKALTGSLTEGAALLNEHPRKFHTSRIEVELEGGGQIEYKATLVRGEPLLYSWRVQGGPVYFEFHGEPTEGAWPAGYYRSYQIAQSATQAHGSFVAGFTGLHGWYWRNQSNEPASIILEASGYYSRLGPVLPRAAPLSKLGEPAR